MSEIKEVFKEVEVNTDGEEYSQICINHIEVLPYKNCELKGIPSNTVCGIKGCKNKAHYYIFFK